MKLEDIYPKKYATGDDLQGKPATLVIATVKMEAMHPSPGRPAENKPVLYFERATRGVILTRPLWMQIATVLGSDDTANWPGKSIQLYPEPMVVANQPRVAIRARRAPNGPTTPPPAMTEDEEE